MDIQMEVLIPLAVLLVILLTAVIVLVCRFFVWEKRYQKKKRYRKVSQGVSVTNGYPILPPLKPISTTTQQIETQDQLVPRGHIDKFTRRPSGVLLYSVCGENYRYETVSSNDSDEVVKSSNSSVISEPDTGFVSDVHCPQLSSSEKSSSFGSERSYPHIRHLQTKQRDRFQSVPNLSTSCAKENTPYYKPRRGSSLGRSKGSSSLVSLISKANGKIEFNLFYDVESLILEITVSQLVDLVIQPDDFLPLLEIYDEHQKTGKVHLVKGPDGKLEISDTSNMAFLIYVTLLPKKTFSRHTNVVFGTGNVVFNEKFSIHGYSTEQLSACQLCFHALCKFGRDGEPIVLGEVKAPLRKLQVGQLLPYSPELNSPQEVLEVENYLKPSTDLGYLNVYLSYNPIGQKLIVKIVQATGLPKIGVIGHPNVSIKTCLYYCNKRISKRSTVIKKRARDPVYSDSFEFDLSKDRLEDCDVLFEIRHHGPMYRTIIGYVTIGTSARGEGKKHWKALLDFSYHERRHKIMSHKPVDLLRRQ